MVGKSPITADGEQRAALRALAHSRDRCEADRARAMLLTLLAGPARALRKPSAYARTRFACGAMRFPRRRRR